ncbi:MAG: pseudouridine synthase, partial [Bacillota bacterium]
VAGSPGVGVRLEAYIAKDSAKNKVAVYDHKVGDAKFAALKYWIVEREAERKLSLVEVELETGRPHQIRAQMAHIGMPLFGDQKYGEGRVGEQLALWSHKLRFEHPVTKEMLEFQSVPALKTEPWKWFSTLIQIAP